MRLKEEQIRRLAEKVYDDLSAEGLITLRGERKKVLDGIAAAISRNFAAEQTLERDAEKLLDECRSIMAANGLYPITQKRVSAHLAAAAQDAAARALARWMQGQPGVVQVLHPALPESPGHAAWRRDAKAAACLFSVVFDERFSQHQIDAFCDSLRLFRLGWSWAGPVSLCAPYNVPAIRTQDWPHQGSLVRFAVGLEAVDDLRADLAQALATLGR